MMVAVTTSFGYILASGELSLGFILPTLGVFFLACGSSVFNNYQERATDALMKRTKSRPIPSGRMSPAEALLFGSSLLLLGSAVLYFFSGIVPLLLGWLAAFWYNFVYTPMKKKFALAVVPGSIIGAIPPVIGWTAAGGELLSPAVMALSAFFFIWQIPHFWLLLMIHGKDYSEAGFPTLTDLFTKVQLSRITFIWIVALSISCLLLPFFNVTSSKVISIFLLLLGGWLMIKTSTILSEKTGNSEFRKAFININLYVLIVIISLSFDKLFLTVI
jgi:protoheme IX farnesyltransferase